MDLRTRILEAAAKVYAEVGYRGATTRRIAAEAGCNELTLFRHFGTKSVLIHDAVSSCGPESAPYPLPEIAVDPYVEVMAWGKLHFDNLRQNQSLIRTTIGEIEEHPELVGPSDPYARCYEQLAEYVARLQAAGRAERDLDPLCAAATFLNTILMNAIMRDVMPKIITHTPEHDLDQFVRHFLRGIGVSVPLSA